LAVWQTVFGYRFTKKWSVQWQNSSDFFDRNVKYSDNSLGVEFRQNLNNAGRPLFLGTSLWLSDNHFNRKYHDSVREQTIVPQLSLSKQMSLFFTFELFANYPFVIHSNINIPNIDRYPQIGINVYLF